MIWKIVYDFLLSKGIDESEIVFGAVNTSELNKTLYFVLFFLGI